MINTILLNILSTGLFVSSLAPSTPVAPQYSFTTVLPEKNFVSRVVGKDDTLSKIAFEKYGDEGYWEYIWKDNPQIQDPNNLEEGTLLKIAANKPKEGPKSLANWNQPVTEPVESQPEATIDKLAQSVTPAPTAAVVQPAATGNAPKVLSEEQLTHLGTCEAGMDPAKNTGNGYYGAFQFSYGTWQSMGTGYERADQAPLEVQKEAVQRLVSRSSIYTQFPSCARKMASAGII